MKVFILAGFISTVLFFNGIAQSAPFSLQSSASQSLMQNLFATNDILNITLKGNMRELLNNRTGEAKAFPIMIKYDDKGRQDSLFISMKTRGHFRRIKSNCIYPPLLLDFAKAGISPNSLFAGQLKLKLVVPCDGEDFVVHEWLVYQLYNLLTPFSYRARLVRATLEDNVHKSNVVSFYGILLEDDKQVALRNNMVLVKRRMKPQQVIKKDFLKMAVFEYLIGNTDWSVEYLQNINLLAVDSMSAPVPVPHDFDLSGIVNTPYALPAEELQLSSVQERRYRGYCIKDMKDFDSTMVYYNQKKKEIYDLYTNCSLLDTKYKNSTVKYLDEFYSTINNPKKMLHEFGYPCNPDGTGNIIIKGLKD